MNKYQRAKARIARDKAAKALYRSEKYKDNDNFDSVITTQHFIEALVKCRVGVSWKGSVQLYTQNAISEISYVRGQLKSGTLPELASIKRIILYERGKRRVIVPITIKDRMVQRVLCDHALVPRFKDALIYDNGASMKGKGVEFTRERMMHHIKGVIKDYGTDFYVLTFDFKSFFDSIPHATCLRVLNDTFEDRYIKGLTMAIIKSYQKSTLKNIKNHVERAQQKMLLDRNRSKGICLGSQISQVMALAVPSRLDHYVKDYKGVKHYIRYMDDGVVFSNDKAFLHELYAGMQAVCSELGLVFNTKKTRIVKASRGFTFMKVRYRVAPSGKIVRTMAKSGIVRMRRKLKKFSGLVGSGRMTMDDVYNSMQSWVAHSYIAQSYHARKNMFKLYNELFNGYKITRKYNHVKGGERGELLQADRWKEFRWCGDTTGVSEIPA